MFKDVFHTLYFSAVMYPRSGITENVTFTVITRDFHSVLRMPSPLSGYEIHRPPARNSEFAVEFEPDTSTNVVYDIEGIDWSSLGPQGDCFIRKLSIIS
jgi:hypothetical protein